MNESMGRLLIDAFLLLLRNQQIQEHNSLAGKRQVQDLSSTMSDTVQYSRENFTIDIILNIYRYNHNRHAWKQEDLIGALKRFSLSELFSKFLLMSKFTVFYHLHCLQSWEGKNETGLSDKKFLE